MQDRRAPPVAHIAASPEGLCQPEDPSEERAWPSCWPRKASKLPQALYRILLLWAKGYAGDPPAQAILQNEADVGMYGRVVDVRDVAAAHVRAAEVGVPLTSSTCAEASVLL